LIEESANEKGPQKQAEAGAGADAFEQHAPAADRPEGCDARYDCGCEQERPIDEAISEQLDYRAKRSGAEHQNEKQGADEQS
jgi:hypothetical protein